MTLLDRYIMRRFLTNFVILFMLIYLLATSIDLILQLDEFMQAVEQVAGHDAGICEDHGDTGHAGAGLSRPACVFSCMPTFSADVCGCHGLHAVADVSIVASWSPFLHHGVSLYRVAWPMIVTAFVLNMLHIVNSNVVLPQFAPLLIRGHSDLERGGVQAFAIPLTEDGAGSLLHAPAYHRDTRVLEHPTFLERDEYGRTVRHTSARSAQWSEDREVWALVDGIRYNRTAADPANTEPAMQMTPPPHASRSMCSKPT